VFSQYLHILLVEDDPTDAERFLRAFAGQATSCQITVVRNGTQALARLRGDAGQRQLPHPCLIFAELNLPDMHGLEFIQALRSDERLRRLIVFVLTDVRGDEAKQAAYEQQVAGYLLKGELDLHGSRLVKLVDCYQRFVEFPPL
jgi:CheY-like chemotaxis protein